MKKITSLLIVAVLLVTCLVTTAFAAAPAITVDTVTAGAGDTVAIPVKISGNTGFTAYGLKLDYNNNALELVSVEAGAQSKGFFDANLKNGKIAFAASGKITGDGVLFTAKFKVLTDKISTYDVKVIWDQLSTDLSATPSVKNGGVTVACQHTKTSVKNTKEATCEAEGYTGDTVCSHCGKVVTSGQKIAKTAHSYGSWTQVKAPSCTQKGEETRSCTKCGHKDTRSVSMASHKWDNGVVTTTPTCTTAGKKTITCTVCNKTKTTEIEATGHTWDAGVVTVKPGCETGGLMTHTCTFTGCNATKTETMPMTGHAFTTFTSNGDATCEKDGTKTAVCSNCGATVTEVDEGSMKAHEYKKGICTACGTKDPNYKSGIPVWIWILLLILSLIAAALLYDYKKNNLRTVKTFVGTIITKFERKNSKH